MNLLDFAEQDLEEVVQEETLHTYKLKQTKIQGYVDNLDSLVQAVVKELQTEKYEYPIYDFDYGSELHTLLGQERAFVVVEAKRMILEVLAKYPQITNVSNWVFEHNGDEMYINFTIETEFGNQQIGIGVN